MELATAAANVSLAEETARAAMIRVTQDAVHRDGACPARRMRTARSWAEGVSFARDRANVLPDLHAGMRHREALVYSHRLDCSVLLRRRVAEQFWTVSTLKQIGS